MSLGIRPRKTNRMLLWFGGLKHTKISGTREWIMIAWNLFSSDVPESFIFGLTLFNVRNINFIQNHRTHGHQLCGWHKAGTGCKYKVWAELGSKRSQRSAPILTKNIVIVYVCMYQGPNITWAILDRKDVMHFGCQKSNAILSYFRQIKVCRIRRLLILLWSAYPVPAVLSLKDIDMTKNNVTIGTSKCGKSFSEGTACSVPGGVHGQDGQALCQDSVEGTKAWDGG